MDWTTARRRFAFLRDAFNGVGGFAPVVTWGDETASDGTVRRLPQRADPSYLTPYQRESAKRFAGRSACAVYENHLRTACERFVAYLGRRRPLRDGVAGLAETFAADCDMRGTPLDQFLQGVALECKARGSMLVVLDTPVDAPASLADQMARRLVPYLRTLAPENVEEFEIDDRTGLFKRVSISAVHEGKPVIREWDQTHWRIIDGDTVQQAEHGFGACPVLAVTESGSEFPVVGKYAQIADLSRSLFNKRSERDEILRSQTFSLLTLQLPKDASVTDVGELTARIGTDSMLCHQGDTPAFISPDSGPAEVYASVIAELEASIKRIGYEDATTSGTQQESGTSRRLRFEALNADLTTFSGRMQSLEVRVWALVSQRLGITPPAVEWPSDYNIVDTMAELDILAGMDAGGFPAPVLVAKRKAIAAAEFDTADADTKLAVMGALDQQAQAGAV